jgi:hypothetical protein
MIHPTGEAKPPLTAGGFGIAVVPPPLSGVNNAAPPKLGKIPAVQSLRRTDSRVVERSFRHHRFPENVTVVTVLLRQPSSQRLRHPDLPPDTQGTMSMGEEME